jgi:hypothetical protein
VDLGGANPARDGSEVTVWLHADPHGLLGVPRLSEHDAIRRAYRRLARVRHPDAGRSDGQFDELQRAARAALGDDEAEVMVEPTEGAWWSFAGFLSPAPSGVVGHGAIVGLAFEARDLETVPLRDARDLVHVSYGGEVLPLSIRYSLSVSALPVLRAKAALLLESAFLVLFCLTLIPLLAVALSLESYVLSDGSVVLFWTAMLVTVALGYGALIAALAAAGKPVPYPRRAVARLRGKRAGQLALPPGKR